MQEALVLVKAEFGNDAVILSSRTVRNMPLGMGLFGKSQLELTAAIDYQPAASGSTEARTPLDEPADAMANRVADSLRLTHVADDATAKQRTKNLAKNLAKTLAKNGAKKRSTKRGAISHEPATAQPLPRAARRATTATPNRRNEEASSVTSLAGATGRRATQRATASDPSDRLRHEVEGMTGLIRELSTARRKGRRAQLSTELVARLDQMTELFDRQDDAQERRATEAERNQTASPKAAPHSAFLQPYANLLSEQGIETSLAHRLIDQLDRAHSRGGWQRDAYAKAFLAQELMGKLQVSGPIEVRAGEQRIVALVGPTGVGKTTTVAKLAAEYQLRRRQKVSLITVDTFRMAAAEQLRAYAEIMELEVAVVRDAQQFHNALAAAGDSDLVLVDTAGRSPRDPAQIDALSSCFAAAPAIEAHLVLSCTTKDVDLRKTVHHFNRLNFSHLLFSKLDESEVFGSLVNLPVAIGKPVSYLTTGQNVPEDIEVATKERLVDLIVDLSSAPIAA